MRWVFELLVFSLIVGICLVRNDRSKAILRKWADANGFEILQKKVRWFYFGPFEWLTTGRSQIIYSFTARDRQGDQRSGWARCGSYWGGIFFSDKIEIRWDEERLA
jgi:hypothetical protein